MKQKKTKNTIQVFPHIYSLPYYELESWKKVNDVQTQEDVLLDLQEIGEIRAPYTCKNIGVFTTKQDALWQIEELLDTENNLCEYFFLREKPLHTMMYDGDYLKEWLYWKTALVDESLVRNYDLHNNPFMGRPKEMIRHKIGDIVIVFGHRDSHWGVIASTPCIYDGQPHGDYSDDQYKILTQPVLPQSRNYWHEHILSHRIIQPTYIPDYVKELLESTIAVATKP